jgi:hypothetical protein
LWTSSQEFYGHLNPGARSAGTPLPQREERVDVP